VTRLRTLVDRLLADPPEALFAEIRMLLAAFGFVEVRSRGSHHIFRDRRGRMLVLPKLGGRKVKRTYVRRIVELLELEDWHDA